MRTMRTALLAGILCAVWAIGAYPADLGQIKSVYILQMSHGLDQYLANHLTGNGVLKVVTDPERAQAILTDEIGERFEQQLEELYPPPPEEPEPEPEAKDSEEAKEEEPTEEFVVGDVEDRPRRSSFGRGKGNVFLIDRDSRRVVWSMFHRPKDQTPKELNKAAERIVANLKASVGGL